MKPTILMVAAAAMALPFAAQADPDCTGVAEKMPMWELVKSFEEAGGTVDTVKVTDDNCYGIYGYEGEQKVEIYYDSASGEELEREEG